MAQIVRAGKHLLGLINEVLDLARVESGKLALTPEPVHVRETLEEALSLVKPLAAERRRAAGAARRRSRLRGAFQRATLQAGDAQSALERREI